MAGSDGRLRQVVVEWSGPATLGQVLERCALSPDGHDGSVWVDGEAFSSSTAIDHAGVRDGSIVSLTPPARSPLMTDVAGGRHLAVVGGPGAGLLFPLPAGRALIGRGPECTVVLPDPEILDHHLALEVDAAGVVTAEDPGSGGTLSVQGTTRPLPTRVEPSQTLRLGSTLVEVRDAQLRDGVVHRHGTTAELRRPPRLRRPPHQPVITWPAEPEPPRKQAVPLAAAAAPLAMGLVLYLATHQVLTLLLVGVSPIMVALNALTSRRSGRIHYRRAMTEYRGDVEKAEADLARRLRDEGRERREDAPDPATVLAAVAGPRRRLWERRRSDEDFLVLRLGLATLPSAVRREVQQGFARVALDPVNLDDVPAVIPLPEAGVLGLAGRADLSSPAASWLVAQVAALSGPADVRLVVLAGERPDAEERWGWTRWLPHVAPTDPGGAAAFGTTRETIEARVTELVELIGRRQGDGGGTRTRDWPRVVVILDPAHDMRRVPGMDIVLQQGPAVGVYGLCVEEAEGYLPAECTAVVSFDPTGHAVLRRSGRADLAPIEADLVPPEWSEAIGRGLAVFRDPEVTGVGGSIPSSVRLVDLLGLDRLHPPAVLDAWSRSRRSTSAVVGVGSDGPVSLDLRVDGPHGLVAGTTGAGKSEFLQTLVAALAVANRHDALNFLLVDYKGGSAFRDCALLPHTVGVVTDLDGHLTERALTSLSAELRRREEILARAGAKDIDDYTAMKEPVGPLPRLLIVIDEFAGLVAELPAFVSGLVGIAQRGRSLGIHLLLATQRPSGVVSPEIRANTNLRVALRVTSPVESVDIIDAPDAAWITTATPGRAYLRTGHSALTAFQAARVGGVATPVVTEAGPEVAAADAGWKRAGLPPLLVRESSNEAIDPADTDLARLTEVLIQAADASGVPRQRQPWLAPLPGFLRLSEVAAAEFPIPGAVPPAPFGLVDLPGEQRQAPAVFDPAEARHLVVGGGPGTGRSTFLRTLAVSLASHAQPGDVWLYVIDCGGGELRRLAELPHCGAVVTRTETDRADRVLRRLHAEMSRRLQVLAAEGFTDVAEQRGAVGPERRLPYVVVLVDRWEGFMSSFDGIDGGRLTDLVLDLVREGGAAGIRLVITGDRSALTGKLGATIEDRICLNLPDRSDFAFAGFDLRHVPEDLPPGRGVRTGDGAELQIAVVGSDTGGQAQAAAITTLAGAWREHLPSGSPGARPFRVDVLPAELDEEAVRPYLVGRPASPHWALLGLGGDELQAIGVDLRASGGFVVGGPRRSGRSNALSVMARSLLVGGCQVVAFCPRATPLRALRGEKGVLAVFDGDDPSPKEALQILNAVEGPLAVIVDDAMLLHGAPVAELLEHVAREGPDQGHVLVIAGVPEEMMRPMRGFVYVAAQTRSGILLTPEHNTDGELLGVRLPRSAVFRQPIGRGIFVDGGQLQLVQTPLAAA